MECDYGGLDVVIIDKHSFWRNVAADALSSAGFRVATAANYDYRPSDEVQGKSPDVVILGCAKVGEAELKLVRHLLQYSLRLIVLSTILPTQVMRELFLEGVEDAREKSYDPEKLIGIVKGVLENSTAPSGGRV